MVYVGIYCRVSWSKQSKYWESLDNQEQECRRYCENMGYTVLWVFKEQYTWTTNNRPKLEEVYDFIRNSELPITHIIIHKIDRNTRWGMRVHEGIKDKLKELWSTLRDTQGIMRDAKNVVQIDGINTDKYNWVTTNEEQYAENISVMISQDERNRILQRMLGQSIKNNKRGFKVRNSDFGFKNEKVMTEKGKKTIQIENPEESFYIKKIYELRSETHFSDKKICDELNRLWFKTRKRYKWNKDKTEIIWSMWQKSLCPEQLQRFIARSVYAGVICEEWTWNKAIKAPYEGLVSIDTWNKANKGKKKIVCESNHTYKILYDVQWTEQKERFIRKLKSYNPDFPYARMLKCSICWGKMTSEKSRSSTWRYYSYYTCRGKKGAKHKNHAFNSDKVNVSIQKYFSQITPNKDVLKVFDMICDEIYSEEKESVNTEKTIQESNISKLESKQKYILENINQLLPYPELLEAKNKELEDIKQKLKEHENTHKTPKTEYSLERFKKFAHTTLTNLDTIITSTDEPEKIEFGFKFIFWEPIEYEKIKSRTHPIDHLLALASKKEFQLKWNSSVNRKWWVIRGSNPGPSP